MPVAFFTPPQAPSERLTLPNGHHVRQDHAAAGIPKVVDLRPGAGPDGIRWEDFMGGVLLVSGPEHFDLLIRPGDLEPLR